MYISNSEQNIVNLLISSVNIFNIKDPLNLAIPYLKFLFRNF